MILEGAALAEWLESRCGKLTASRMADAMAFRKDGKPTAERSKLMRELMAERITGNNVRHFVTDAMAWGLEKEEEAKAAYEARTGALVLPSGFYDHPTIQNLGATPDGLLEGNGLIETKAPTTPTFIEWQMAGKVPDEHTAQMVIQLACTGRQWCDFVAYDPRIRNPSTRLFIRRYEPTAEEIAKVEAAAVKFLGELDLMWELFHAAAA